MAWGGYLHVIENAGRYVVLPENRQRTDGGSGGLLDRSMHRSAGRILCGGRAEAVREWVFVPKALLPVRVLQSQRKPGVTCGPQNRIARSGGATKLAQPRSSQELFIADEQRGDLAMR
jgi:hypothetical protein